MSIQRVYVYKQNNEITSRQYSMGKKITKNMYLESFIDNKLLTVSHKYNIHEYYAL